MAIFLSLLLIITSIPVHSFAENSEINGGDVNLVESLATKPKELDLSEHNKYDNQSKKKKPVELKKERKEKEKVFDNQDGTFTKKLYNQPIHIKKGNTWEEISTKLAENGKEKVKAENTGIDVEFEKGMKKGKYAQFQQGNDYLSFSILAANGEAGEVRANEVVAEVEDNKITYKQVFPHVDIRNIQFNDSVKEDIILNQYTGHNIFKYEIKTNLTPKLEEDGSVTFTNRGDIKFSLPKPVMSDSNMNPESGETAKSDNISFKLETVQKDLYILSLTADTEWLKSPDRVFPIYLDPTVDKSRFNAFGDAFVSKAYPTTNYSGGNLWDAGQGAYTLKVGYYDSTTGDNYAYLKHDLAALKGATIVEAKFWLNCIWSYSTTPTDVWLAEANSSWNPKTITWNNSPSVTNIGTTKVARNNWTSFDVKSTVQKWATNPATNYGFAVHTSGNGQTYWKKFVATENNTVAIPELTITYSFPDLVQPKVTPQADGNGTGYLDISWTKVSGAIGYSVGIYNGKDYDYFDFDANQTSWSTKGEGIWPTDSEISKGVYKLHYDGGGNELPLDPSLVYKNANMGVTPQPPWVNDSTYWVVVRAEYPDGSISRSPYAVPKIPVDKPKGSTYTFPLDPTRGHIALNWVPIKGASGYKVLIYNGIGYDEINVGNVTSWSTEGQNLWPTDTEISSTEKRFHLHTDKKGVEFPLDPSPVYRNSGGAEGNSKDYWIRVIAYGPAGTQIGAQSDYGTFRIADPTSSLGLKDYWASIDVVGGKVNALNGNLVINETDFQLTGNGPNITIARTYNSQDKETGLFGKGWFSSIEENIKEATNGDLLYTTGDKSNYRFVYDATTKSYSAPSGVYLKASKDSTNGTYTIEDKDKSKTTFGTNGKIQSEIDDHSKVVKYEYTNNQLTKITDATGNRSFTFNYKGKFIGEIIGPEQKKVSFDYDSDNLVSSTTPKGKLYRYGYYENSSLLQYLYDPKHTEKKEYKTTFLYENEKVTDIIDPVNKKTNLKYIPDAKQVIITDPKGKKNSIIYNLSGNLIESSVDIEKLNLKTIFQYLGNNLVKTITPKNQEESATYDAYGNVTSVTDPSGTEKAEYNSNNDVIKATDNENRTTTVAYKETDAVSVTDNNSLTSSVAMYDSYGNPTEASSDYASGHNLLKNSSMEDAQNMLPTNWTISSLKDSGDGWIESQTKKMGENSLRLNSSASSTDYGYVTASQVVPVQPNTTYTLSGYIETAGVKNANTVLEVTERDKNNVKVKSSKNDLSKISSNVYDWTKRQFTFTTEATTTNVVVWLTIDHTGDAKAVASAWFDNIQLEKGTVSSSYNPIANSSFEDNNIGTIPSWVRTCTGTNCGDAAKNVSNLPFDGNYSLFLERTSESQANTWYRNRVVLNQSEPKAITLTGMSRSENVSYNGTTNLNNDYAILATVTYNNGDAINYYAKFPLGTHEWNRGAVVINPPGIYGIKSIDVYTLFRNNNKGKVWFDDIRLIEGSILSKNTYNTNGYVQDSTDVEGNTSSFTYDEYGNKKTETDPKGNKKSYEYTLDNQLEKVTLPNKSTITYHYDLNGNIEEKIVQDTKGITKTNTFVYDQDNKLLNFIDSLGRKITHEYDNNGNKTKTLMPNKHELEWNYDTADRLTNVKRDTKDAFTYELDNNGNQTKIIDHVNSIIYTNGYDTNDRLFSWANDRGGSINWSFHDTASSKTGKVKDLTVTQGSYNQKTSYSYNSLDQNTKIVDGNGKTYSFDYNEEGNVDTYTAGNGAGSTFVYDHTGKVKELMVATKSGETILSETYEYDKNGNRSGVRKYDAPLVFKNVYDSLNQLEEETLPDGRKNTYGYDEFGNRNLVNGKVVKYNSGNQLTDFGTESIGYDENGNRTSDDKYTYQWDAVDQLISVTEKGKTTPLTEYKYDDAGRRIEKIKQSNGTTSTIRYIYDGNSINVLYETDDKGNVLRHYIYSASGILVAMKSQGQTFYYHYNPHGDVIAMTDDSGKIVASYQYDAWGNVLSSDVTGLAADNPFGYAGYMYDKEIGMYYLMARYYHPVHGVFLSMDPDPGDEDDPITQNGYSYANNNPVMNVDPDGHWAHIVAGAAIGAVIGAGISAYDQWRTSGKVKLGKTLTDAGVGAVSGALAATGVGVVGQMIGGAAINSSVYLAQKRKGVTLRGYANSAIVGGIGGITGGAGAKGAKLLGVWKTSNRILKTAKSPRKILMYNAKKAAVKKTAFKSAGQFLGGGVASYGSSKSKWLNY